MTKLRATALLAAQLSSPAFAATIPWGWDDVDGQPGESQPAETTAPAEEGRELGW